MTIPSVRCASAKPMPSPGSAPAASGSRIPSLDGLRAVSILLVILAHVARTGGSPVPEGMRWYAAQGAVGVDVFFAISGFLITALLLREREASGTISLRGFYARRALRILPAFFAFLLGMALFDRLGLIHLVRHDWFAALTYTANFFDDISRPLGHLWSLSVEEHFYLVWPLVFLALGPRRAGKAALICLLAEPLVRWLTFRFAPGRFVIDFATFTRLDAIAAGCLLAVAARLPAWRGVLGRLESKPAMWFFGGAGVLALSTCVLSHSGKYALFARPWVNAIAICIMIWTATRFPNALFGRVLNRAPLAWIGRLSYSLYLWQQVFLDPTNGGTWMCRFPQNLGLCLIAAIASYYVIERPFLNLKHRWSAAGSRSTGLSAAPRREPSVKGALFGAACLSLQPLILNVLSVPVMAYIIHRLGPEGYGQWMAATALIAVSTILTSLGLRGAFVRGVSADPPSAPVALAEQMGLRLSLTALAAALAILACRALGYAPAVIWCTAIGAVGLGLTTIATTFGDLLQAFGRIKTMATVNLIAGLALTGASALAAWGGSGPIAIAAAYLIGPAISAALSLVIVRRSICPVGMRWSLGRFGVLLVQCRFFAAQQFLSVASSQAEALMLPRLIGASQFGFFSAGAVVANRLTAIPDGLCTAAYPGMVKAHARNGASGAARLVRTYIIAGAGVGALIALAVTFVADPIGRLLFPEQSEPFAAIVRITIWSLPLAATEMVMSYALNAAGKDGFQARASAPAAALSLLGAATLVYGFGVSGACWSTLLRPAIRIAFLSPAMFRTVPQAASSATADDARSSTTHATPLLQSAR